MSTPSDATTTARPESGREFLARLRDPLRWRGALYDLGLWFLFGLVVTEALARFAPGYPIVVGTVSAPTGIYWLERQPGSVRAGDYVSFAFQPSQPWLQERYGHKDRVYTKQVAGRGGDRVRVSAARDITLCTGEVPVEQCRALGRVQTQDSAGRPLWGFVPVGGTYTLQPGELWLHSSHPRSFDSRYYGPIREATVRGRAKPLWLFAIPE